MTRINCIPPAELTDKHLLAEYRELPRVFKLAYAAYQRGEDPATHPQEYTLGKGHVKFFYTRLFWLDMRFRKLCAEMNHRGFKPKYEQAPTHEVVGIPFSWCKDWQPTPDAQTINRARITERLSA